MSLESGPSSALDTAVGNSIASGVTYAVAAGSSNPDACGFSPARVASAITVRLYLPTHSLVSPAIVRDALVNSATTNVIGDVGLGSPNRLLYSLVP